MTSHVQDVTLHANGTGPFTVDITTSAGSLLTIAIEAYNSGDNPISISSVTDSAGNTWTYTTAQNNQSPPAGGQYTGSYYAFASAGFTAGGGAVTSVVVHFNATISDTCYITVSEFSDPPSGLEIDAAAATAMTGSGSSQATPQISVIGNDVVIAQTAEDAHAWSAVSSPFTVAASNGDAAWAIINGAGTAQATFSGGASQSYWASVILALAPSGTSHTATASLPAPARSSGWKKLILLG